MFFTVVWQLNRHIAGIKIWLTAVYSQALGWMLLSMRDHISDLFSIVLSNYLILQSILLFYLGVRYHLEKRFNLPRSLALLAFSFIPIQSYFTYVEPAILPRILLVYGYCIVIMGLIVRTLYGVEKTNKTTGMQMYQWLAVTIICLCFVRVASVTAAIQGLYDAAFSNYVSALLGFFMPQGLTLGVFILAYEKREKRILALRKKAKLDAELKNRYLATLSHELRTPLNGIVGMAQLMLDDTQISNPNRSKLTTIVKSGQHLAELANNVLEYSAMEGTDDKSLRLTSVRLLEFLNTIEDLLKPLALEKSLTFNVQCEHNLPKYIFTDVAKLRSILTNLLSNSIKYTEQGSVILSINRGAKNKLLFAVEDTGKGMSEAHFEEMLKPFNRGSMDVHKQSGVGLGLAIVQYLLTAMGSQLIWQKRQSTGTTVLFELDVAIDDVNEIEAVDSFETTTPIKTNNQLELLIVEDMELNVEVLTALLNHQHKLTIANTGQKAIDFLNIKSFDAILLDIQLPDMSGIDVYNAKANIMKNINTPVIALTASVSSKDIEYYQQLNFIDIVEKPIIKSKLYTALSKIKDETHTLSESEVISEPNPNFSSEPLTLLLENLTFERINQIALNLESELETEIERLTHFITTKDIEHFQQLSHKLSSRYGQFGLIEVNQTLKSMSCNTQPNLEELTTLRAVMQDAIPALFEYLNNYKNDKQKYTHHNC